MINQPFGKYDVVDFANIVFGNFNVILKVGSNKEKSKITLSMLHHVFAMRFSTIVECFSTIQFLLLYMKENIKLFI